MLHGCSRSWRGSRVRPHAHRLASKKARHAASPPSAGVQRGLVGEIISRFERKGFKLVALKMFQCTK